MSGLSVTLVVEGGPESGRTLKIASARTVIGRRKGDVQLKDAEISGQHAEINVTGDKVSIKDLGSTNGTFVNGKKLPGSDLKDGDRLTIGQSKILVKIVSANRGPGRSPDERERADSPAARPRPEPRPRAPEPRAVAAGSGRAASAVASPAAVPRRASGSVNIDGIGALISEELEGFSEQTDSVIMDLARADEELKLPYRTNLHLEVLEGPDLGMKVQFPKGNMVIGRLNADVVLKDSDISRRHALVEAYTRDKVFIKDLASTNGTFVNGQKITYDKLKSGDKIRVGKTVLRFLIEQLK